MAAQGIDQAWESLSARDPAAVARRAAVEYSSRTGRYAVPVLGHTVNVDPATSTLLGSDPQSEFILTKTGYFSRLSILHYLLGAQQVVQTGRLLKPEELRSGQFHQRGSHVLPLDQLAARFSACPDDFLMQAAAFGGEPREYGDRAMELRPFPRVPVTLILWQEDDEFPARSSLLFDETCERHLPPDIVWSVAMMCIMVMLKYDGAGR